MIARVKPYFDNGVGLGGKETPAPRKTISIAISALKDADGLHFLNT